MTTVITGASDDLIEIDGDCSEEFNILGEDQPIHVVASDGTVLAWEYDSLGEWRCRIVRPGRAEVTIVRAPGDDNAPPGYRYAAYSDRAELSGEPITWVAWAADIVIGDKLL